MNKFAQSLRVFISQALEHYQLPASESAVRLLMMIAAHESGGFMYGRQKGGPALSMFQIEPATYRDVIRYAGVNKHKFPLVPLTEAAHCLLFDFEFAIAIARLKLWQAPEPLPHCDDAAGLARYAKRVWNSELGKATAEKYEADYKRYIFSEEFLTA
jgi:hypothetical protein